MTAHTVSDTNPTYVTGADQYRISVTGLLTPDNPQFTQMEELLNLEHRRPDGYGIAFLESEEHSRTYYGSIQQIEEHRAGGSPALDLSKGALYAFWPNGSGWEDFIPATTWNAGGQGIVTEFDHPLGGRVTVYEYVLEGRDTDNTPMVGFHCDRCHPDPNIDHETSMPNRGPQDRRWSARNAREHIRSHTVRCKPIDPHLAEAVQAVANQQYGLNNPTVSWDSHCATTGPCGQIRHMRARA
ncbi:hypothetical protein [Streptomyces zaomyceticus]|uniref:hypothetical protein n=1 Tax=Streptomyces zaomyceticus TaxID=68286 RepID=UPI00368E9FA0